MSDFMNTALPWLEWTGVHMSPWKLIGLTGALMFGTRWFVQFWATRRAALGKVAGGCRATGCRPP